jgi:chromosome segregation ATPase
MIFALGFLVAGLVALAFAPAFWRRAIRLTRRRLETQVPLSVEEIRADRDQLRAEFAVAQRRLEIDSARLAEAHAADRAELGRRAGELGALKQEMASRIEDNRLYTEALAKAEAEIAQLAAERGALTGDLYDAGGLYQTKQEELVKLTQALEAMSALADERLAGHAAADARAAGLELRLGDLSRTLAEAENRFTERTAHAGRLNDALVLATRNLELLEGNYAALQKQHATEAERAARLSREVEELRQQRDADQGRLRSLQVKIQAHEAALEDAKHREDRIHLQRDQQIEKAREAERALSEKYQSLRSEFAALEGARDVARRRCEELQAELAQQRAERGKSVPLEAAENAALRQGVSEIGAAIVRLAQASGEAPPDLAAPESEIERPAAPNRASLAVSK